MDVLSPLLHVVLRSLVVLFPLTVGWLAFRRLALSKSSNAWLYAAICLFAAVTAAGVLPWTLGLTGLNWVLVSVALLSPVLWIGVIVVCDVSRGHRYGNDPLIDAARSVVQKSAPKLAPLVLETPVLPDVTEPVFRHRATVRCPAKAPREFGQKTRTILSLARDIRGNPTSDRHRPKLLPPPVSKELPFLKDSRRA